MRQVALWFLVCLIIDGCDLSRRDTVRTVSLCELGDSDLKGGEAVKLTAVFESDGGRSSSLHDAACPTVVVSPYLDPSVDDRTGSKLEGWIYDVSAHKHRTEFTCELVGTFEVVPGEDRPRFNIKQVLRLGESSR